MHICVNEKLMPYLPSHPMVACGGEKAPEAGNAPAYADATEVLTTIFAAYAEDNKFPVAGGDEANASFEAPAKYDYTLADELNVVAKLPATQSANIADAATGLHMMNANSFTGAAYKLVEGADAAAFPLEGLDVLHLAGENIYDIHDLVVHDYGPDKRFVSLHMEVDGSKEIFSLHDAADLVERQISDELGCEAVIHMDPIDVNNPVLYPASCKVAAIR